MDQIVSVDGERELVAKGQSGKSVVRTQPILHRRMVGDNFDSELHSGKINSIDKPYSKALLPGTNITSTSVGAVESTTLRTRISDSIPVVDLNTQQKNSHDALGLVYRAVQGKYQVKPYDVSLGGLELKKYAELQSLMYIDDSGVLGLSITKRGSKRRMDVAICPYSLGDKIVWDNHNQHIWGCQNRSVELTLLGFGQV
jgi:hypothetical protein